MLALVLSPDSLAKLIPKLTKTPRLTSINNKKVKAKMQAKNAKPIATIKLWFSGFKEFDESLSARTVGHQATVLFASSR